MEDLAIWHQCPFWVRDDGQMVIRNSTIRMIQDPRLETAFFFSRIVNTNWGKNDRTPWIHRVVNLQGTDDPILSFDLSWRRQNTNLLVLGQSSPDRGFQRIARIPPADGEYGEWTHHEVSLQDLGGRVSRIAITPRNNDYGAIVIANVSVRENGTGSLNDWFPTGAEYYRGWFTRGLDPFMEWISRWSQWDPLIRCYGDIDIIDSSIVAPADLPRYVGNWVSEWEPGEGWSYSNYVTASSGGEIEMGDGSLVIDNTQIVNVPLNAHGAIIDVKDSKFEGDAHLLTLLRSHGSVVDTHFLSRDTNVPNRPFSTEHSFDRQYLWGLSIMNNIERGPVRVEGCTFQGCEIGLEARTANVTIEDCRFVEIKKCAMWYRESISSDDWETINGTNTFSKCLGQWFLRTEPCALERIGQESTMVAGWLIEPSLSELPDFRYLWLGYNEGTILLPSLVVDPSGLVTEIPHSIMIVRTDDWRFTRLVVERGATDAVVDIEGATSLFPPELDVEDEFYGTGAVRILPNDPTEVGTLSISVHLKLNRLRMMPEELDSIILANNGFHDRIIDISDTVTSQEGVVEAIANASIPVNPGRNSISLSIWRGNQDGGQEVVNESFTVVRATGMNELDEAKEVVTEGSGVVILDPGVQLKVSEVPLGDGTMGTRPLLPTTFLFNNGSSFTISQSRNGTSTPKLVSIGNGTQILNDISCDKIYIEGYDVSLDIINLTCRRVSFDISRCSIQISGFLVEEEIERLNIVDSELSLVESSLAVISSRNYDFYGSHVVMNETEFTSNLGSTIVISLRAENSFSMSSCYFVGLSLHIEPSISPITTNASLELMDCRFSGGSLLAFSRNWSDAHDRYGPYLAVHLMDCEFSDDGSGIIGNGPSIESLSEDNHFIDGAIALGLYDIKIGIEYPKKEVNFTWNIMDNRCMLPMGEVDSYYSSLQDCLVWDDSEFPPTP